MSTKQELFLTRVNYDFATGENTKLNEIIFDNFCFKFENHILNIDQITLILNFINDDTEPFNYSRLGLFCAFLLNNDIPFVLTYKYCNIYGLKFNIDAYKVIRKMNQKIKETIY